MQFEKIIRIFFHLVAFTVFFIQAWQSLNKYFSYPTNIQQTLVKVDTIEKPYVQVCFPNFFDYSKALEYGYRHRSGYLSGVLHLPKSSKPTWMGKNGNTTFYEIQKQIYAADFSKVSINQKINKKLFVLNNGFCLEVRGFEKHLRITTKAKRLRVNLIHNSTDIKVYSKIPLEFGLIDNTSADYKVYEINYEIHDNTIHDGRTCFDYRKQKESYGDCNYNALKNYIYSAYGCYPPWVMDETDNKICEIGLKSKEIDPKLLKKVWDDMDLLGDRRSIYVLQNCLPPCYHVECLMEKKVESSLAIETAYLDIYDEANTVPMFKTVYSFDIFMLSVELGSALGLWLGIIIFFIINNKNAEKIISIEVG